MSKVIVVVLALLAPFLFPWQLTLLLALIASYFVPGVALVVGALMEALYGTFGIPYALILGVLGFIGALFVQRFVKARIMGA
ncbi:MAG TPA: hypothetical protein VNU47_00335 [Candidatus Paceibacterota bacterium]|nr:hypothetical protein [Candidatus Paceibacterota bacterium]